jgi:hypothetical protein
VTADGERPVVRRTSMESSVVRGNRFGSRDRSARRSPRTSHVVTAFPDFANHMLNRRPQTPVGCEVSRMERVRLRLSDLTRWCETHIGLKTAVSNGGGRR